MLDRAYGCLIGSAIGDAMGMPASFMSPEKIKRIYGRISDFLSPDKEQIAHAKLVQGEFTDDTEESLIIADVLIEKRKFDVPLFIIKMREWAIENKMLESTVIGPSTRRFLEAIVSGEDYAKAGQQGDTNGGAMRVAPIGIFYHGNLKEAIRSGMASAQPSHGSRAGLASTAAVAGAICLAVEGNHSTEEIMEAAIQGAEMGEKEGYEAPSPSVAVRIQLAKQLVDQNRDKGLDEICYILYQYIGASMKSYESIPFSLGVFYAADGDYEKGLLAAINIGDDADTNGAIVGALCGAFSGSEKIRPEWIEKVSATNSVDFKKIAFQLLN